eukprot:CAMPEP_0172388350 /NCGR_PEP_ID=MMETSP1061-20121228/5470_1 /TAXON_ID=37318 /ORGANISM="Pseudo-nitzschia pungens, Strain cf. pungens" /LENGTH=306 /DNA_ID=CAMNT_0013118227 /DNA_START=75 /DNA_END=995 /DNA_ORIENTATION=+
MNAAADPEYEEQSLPVVSDRHELLKRGICRVELPEGFDTNRWAEELSQIRPMNLCFEGDGESPLYRNIMEEPEFPFDLILWGGGGGGESGDDSGLSSAEESGSPAARNESSPSGLSEIGRSILRYFPVSTNESDPMLGEEDRQRKILREELRLDNAFCKHYDSSQWDTVGKLHMDPSDITVNMCLHKSEDAEGSYVLFHGTKQLQNLDAECGNGSAGGDPNADGKSDESREASKTGAAAAAVAKAEAEANGDRFLVSQEPGYATIHFGDHPHETTSLRRGSRTNVIMTYLYTDTSRTDATTRQCYF